MTELSDDDLSALLQSWLANEFGLRRDRRRLRQNLLRRVVAITETSTSLKKALQEHEQQPDGDDLDLLRVAYPRHVWFMLFLALRLAATELAVGAIDEHRRQDGTEQAGRN